MPALAVTQPYATRGLDLIDATDRSYRQIESAWASALQIQRALQDLTNVDAETGLAQSGSYFMPSSISSANRSLYELYVNFLNAKPQTALAGSAITVVFTVAPSPVWPVNGLVNLFSTLTYEEANYDPTDNATYVISDIVSNTADTVTLTASAMASCDTLVLIPKNVSATTVLGWIMDLG